MIIVSSPHVEKAYAGIVLKFSFFAKICGFFNDEHFKKTDSPVVLMLSGKIIESSCLHPKNTRGPKTASNVLSENSIRWSYLHPANALLSIRTTFFGTLNNRRSVLANTFSLIISRLAELKYEKNYLRKTSTM